MPYRSSIALALVLLLVLPACQQARTPEERELADLKDQLRDVDSRIAGEERIANMSGEAPSGELTQLTQEKSDLEYKIQVLEDKIERMKGED